MSGSINLTVDQVQPLDFIHWTAPKCPGDNYAQVVAIAPNTDFIVIYRGIRRPVKKAWVTSAVRNELPPDRRTNINPLCCGYPGGKPIVRP